MIGSVRIAAQAVLAGIIAASATAPASAWARPIEDYRITHLEVQGNFTLTDHHGRPSPVAAHRGRVVLIVFGLQMSGLIHLPYLDRTYQLPPA